MAGACVSKSSKKKTGVDKLPTHGIKNFWDVKCQELLNPEMRELHEFLTGDEKLIMCVNVASSDKDSKTKYHELCHLHHEFKD